MEEATTYYATGHRKNATAKVWLIPGGTGTIEINKRAHVEAADRLR